MVDTDDLYNSISSQSATDIVKCCKRSRVFSVTTNLRQLQSITTAFMQ